MSADKIDPNLIQLIFSQRWDGNSILFIPLGWIIHAKPVPTYRWDQADSSFIWRGPFKRSAPRCLFRTSPQIKTLPDSHVAIVQEMGQQSIKMPLDNLI